MLHNRIRNSLRLAIADDKVFHAFIFEGPEGIGKRTLAREFAMALHCESDGEKPCGICPSCIKHKTGNHTDYMEITPEPGKKNISVSKIRAMCEEIFIKPVISDKKVVFIPEADLCETGAQNAMLKCFEEPPSYAVIILATRNLSSLLETIKSRAVIYRLNPCPSSEIEEFIQTEYPEQADKAAFIAAFCGGIIGKAVSLCSEEATVQLRLELFTLLSAFSESRYESLKASDFLSANSDNEQLCYELCMSFFRDLAALKHGTAKLINEDLRGEISSLAGKVTAKAASKALFKLSFARNEKSKYANYDLWITDLMITLWEVLHDKGDRGQI